ncbi:hypothetical protein [Nocardia sp. NPDC050710]|uniref:hypothetical protein n=1 Tax=Nocardia sp. NPDC050710 TaxID=3157220 RepID=UPI0033D98F25
MRDRTGEIVLRAGAVGAVEMPSELGRRVLARLAHPGPVVVAVDERAQEWWTMLTAPVHHNLCDCATFAMLAATRARLVPYGHEIRLPAPRDTTRRWLDGNPADAYRPAPEDVVEAIRVCRLW